MGAKENYLKLRSLKQPITKHLRVIRNAWHFCYAVVFVVKAQCRNIGIALLTP
ncbi:DUF3265 domain-containing protein [Vibrio parahaemolyticus]|nr:DUF3265 domain-containing protein [Vibrio parahaemolyticus]MDA0390516.1 DUF3265 domain-containing protein [Vibrio parahaemolyticus]MDA0395074.1 DUF3265 domain-containing protein [Vibrio parahaemolyticus]MDA0399616.1 DUF3265 domain-containing protein [Vibrio parahaemolyticus]MDA0404281.1 DUF3265 domain-containing protein [Vibrio parahaemolyticus]TOK03625.1 DUF3265 domain-containing protein [Vibrio parahaemolyticus]